MTDQERELFERALYHFGPAIQSKKLLEEMAELQVEILHYGLGRSNLDKIAEEIADVGIMLDQMILLFQCGGAVQQVRAEKVDRLRHMIFREEND